MSSPPLPTHHADYVKWAASKGLSWSGVRPSVLPGRGVGIVATRDIKKGDIVMQIPRTAMLALSDPDTNIYASTSTYQLSIHGRLARVLLPRDVRNSDLDEPIENYGNVDLSPWTNAMPTKNDIERDMPALWKDELRERLPSRAKALLDAQQKKLDLDLAAITAVEFERLVSSNDRSKINTCRAEFTRAWLLVNSRCFYWDYPDLEAAAPTPQPGGRSKKRRARNGATGEGKRKERDRNDCMALCPVVDYFNHDDAAEDCGVDYSTQGYTVTALRSVPAHAELHVSYGAHSNDFLLTEYGFILAGAGDGTRASDSASLDTHILPLLNPAQKDLLKSKGLLGEYTLDRSGVCWRTECAIRAGVMSAERWREFVDSGGEGARDGDAVLLHRVLGGLVAECDAVGKQVNEMQYSDGKDVQAKETLMARWAQIRDMAAEELERAKRRDG